MGKSYSDQQREEAMKLACEIETAAAGQRLGISADTIYTCKACKRVAAPPLWEGQTDCGDCEPTQKATGTGKGD